MPTHLEALPVELCAHIALFLNRHRHYVRRDNSLLALRSVSHACFDAVRRAIKTHPTNDVRFYGTNDVRQITAVGKILGSGCQRITYQGKSNQLFPDKLDALQQVIVVETRGCLRELSICCSTISPQRFLEICSVCPQLKELDADWGLPNIREADMDVFAGELSRLCPLLERVSIVRGELLSPAETYAMHFPNHKHLDLEVEELDAGYAPSRFDKIEAAARQCVGAEALNLGWCAVSADLAERLIRTPLQDRIKTLYFGFSDVSEQTLLRLAAGLKALREIIFPDDFSGSPEFFRSLARARPALKELHFGEEADLIDDACVAAICENLALENLSIDRNDTLTPAVVDIILRSPTAQTLSEVAFFRSQAVTSAGILRLVRGCPRLRELAWYVEGLTPLAVAWPEGTQHGKNVDDLNALLKERGRGHAITFSVDPFKRFGPEPPRGHLY